MANVLNRIDHLMDLQRRVDADLAALAPGVTPHMAKTLEWLGRHRMGTVRHISVALCLPRSTVRWCVNRMMQEGLACYVDGPPRPGRPMDTGVLSGNIELTAAGLRLVDRLQR